MLAALKRSGFTPVQSYVCVIAAAKWTIGLAAMSPGPLLAIVRPLKIRP